MPSISSLLIVDSTNNSQATSTTRARLRNFFVDILRTLSRVCLGGGPRSDHACIQKPVADSGPC